MDWRDDLFAALRFFTRLPLAGASFMGAKAGEADMARALRLAPAAGALIGLAAGLPFYFALLVHEPPAVAALLYVAAAALLTGALHEDGLADVADGFGGGFSRDRKLEIMRDSRIGAFGVVALVLSIALRAAAVAALAGAPGRALLALAATGALSRAACLAPVLLLPPARGDGAGQKASGLTPGAARPVLYQALALAALPWLGGFSLGTCVTAALMAALAGYGVSALARAQIGGQTGDVAGAAQQLAEIAALLVFAAAA